MAARHQSPHSTYPRWQPWHQVNLQPPVCQPTPPLTGPPCQSRPPRQPPSWLPPSRLLPRWQPPLTLLPQRPPPLARFHSWQPARAHTASSQCLGDRRTTPPWAGSCGTWQTLRGTGAGGRPSPSATGCGSRAPQWPTSPATDPPQRVQWRDGACHRQHARPHRRQRRRQRCHRQHVRQPAPFAARSARMAGGECRRQSRPLAATKSQERRHPSRVPPPSPRPLRLLSVRCDAHGRRQRRRSLPRAGRQAPPQLTKSLRTSPGTGKRTMTRKRAEKPARPQLHGHLPKRSSTTPAKRPRPDQT